MFYMKISQNKIAYTTYILIALNLLIYGLEIKLGGSQNSFALERLGALMPEKVLAGEWWRLIGANFLHYGSFHLATNMLSLFFVGRAKRRLQQIILIIIIQFVFDNLIPQVSFHAHLFGFIIGFLISSILVFVKFNLRQT